MDARFYICDHPVLYVMKMREDKEEKVRPDNDSFCKHRKTK